MIHHNPHPSYRPDIDGLRAIAVLPVVIFHTSALLMPGGFVGVDIFFVISGYLISSIIFKSVEGGTFSFLDFYIRRIKRIFPALVIVLLTTWFFAYYDLAPSDLKMLGKHIIAAAGFVSNFVLWQESGYFDVASELKPLLHLWSLGIEEQFYIFWPLLSFLAWKSRFNFLALTLLITLISFICNVLWISHDAVATFYLPLTRFWELLIGGTLACAQIFNKQRASFSFAYLLTASSSRNTNNIKSIIGFFMLLCAIAGMVKITAYPGWWALLPTIGAFLLISAGQEAWVNRHILSHRYAVFIGLISYPLYLWHWPLLAIVRIGEYGRVAKIAAIAISFLLAWITYRFVELPIRLGGKKSHDQLGQSKKVNFSALRLPSNWSELKSPLFLGAALIAVAFIGLKTYSSDGFKDRFPAYISQVVAYPKNFKLSQWREGECYLYSENKFGSNCVDNGFQNSSSNVFLWGDSVAASLSPGFRYVQPNHFSFAQYTVGNCPPFLDYDDPNNKNCREITKSIIKEIETLKPHTVFLSAYWLKFYRANPDQVKDKIPQTVDFLRGLGVKHIVFIGPLPLWNPTLPLMIFQRWKVDHIIPSPERMMLNTDSETLGLDKILHEVSSPLGVTYISAHQLLCDSNGCLTRVGNNYEDIFSFDTMHLTVSGAKFFVNKMFDSYKL